MSNRNKKFVCKKLNFIDFNVIQPDIDIPKIVINIIFRNGMQILSSKPELRLFVSKKFITLSNKSFKRL